MRITPRICLVVGDSDTQHCGVKDYAIRLAEALATIGLHAEVMAPSDWGFRSFSRFCAELRQQRFDVVHVQYPSIGNRSSLGPHILGWMRVAPGCVVTLHEYSALPFPQRLSTNLFRFTADQLLFTVEREVKRFGRTFTPKKIVHIGSNVPAFPSEVRRASDVLYFGQIRPNKGLEQFLELARRSNQLGKPYRYIVIGSISQRREEYYKALRGHAHPEIEWLLDITFERVAEIMASSLAAYLPFPDGASYRRGSLLAALTNGLPPITTVGVMTPEEMLQVLLPASGPEEALAQLERLSSDPHQASAKSRAARVFAERFSWSAIARQHQLVYAEVLSRAGSSLDHQCPASTSTES